MSWGIAFFEYWLAVPANRIGSQAYSAAELKTMQEVITLLVFAGFSVLYLKEPIGWNHLVGFALIAAGAFFIFSGGVEAMALVVASPAHPAVDRYLAEGFEAVPGMSSRFATAICGARHAPPDRARRQRARSPRSARSRAASSSRLALALAEGERAYGFDTFDWPDAGVQERFVANCRGSGVDLARIEAVKRDSRRSTRAELKEIARRRAGALLPHRRRPRS